MNKNKLSDFYTSIGLGKSLYLLTLKAYIRLFLLASILAIPCCVVLQSGTQVASHDIGGGLNEVFSNVTIGNIGTLASIVCGSTNIATNDPKIRLNCPSGSISTIVSIGLSKDSSDLTQNQKDQPDICASDFIQRRESVLLSQNGSIKVLDIFGLLNQEDVIGAKLISYYADFYPKCSTYLSQTTRDSSFVKSIQEIFNKSCRGKPFCEFQFDYNLMPEDCLGETLRRAFASVYPQLWEAFDPGNSNLPPSSIPDSTRNVDSSIPEPILYVVAQCDSALLKVKGFDIELDKLALSSVIVYSDIIIISFLILGFNVISILQNRFVSHYQNQEVEARDFTLMISQLPMRYAQYCDDQSLKSAIWSEIQSLVESKFKDGQVHGQNIESGIVDINIIRFENKKDENQLQIKSILKSLEMAHCEILRKSKQQGTSCSGRICSIEDCIQKQIGPLNKCIDSISNSSGSFKDLTISDSFFIDQYIMKKQQKDYFESIDQVLVTFQNSETKLLLEKYFQKNELCFRFQDLQQKKKDEQTTDSQIARIDQEVGSIFYWDYQNQNLAFSFRYIQELNQGLSQVRPVPYEPEIINWENYRVGRASRLCRRLLGWLSIISILGLSIVCLFGFFNQYMKSQFDQDSIFSNTSFTCAKEVTLQEAFDSTFNLLRMQKEGTMLCFCRQQFQNNSENFSSIDFNAPALRQQSLISQEQELLKNSQTQQTIGLQIEDQTVKKIPNYCQDWLKQYYFNRVFAYGPSLIIVFLNNFLGIPLVIWASYLEAHKSKDSHAYSQFFSAVIIWSINIAFVLVYFMETEIKLVNFEALWYITAGSTLCFALFQMFVPYYVFCLLYYIFIFFKRCADRSLRCSIQRRRNTEADQVFTFQISQNELNSMHKGERFDGGFMQAKIISTIFICMVYSGGMPLLYPICLMYLVIIFWLSKFMIVKYCQKSADFNEYLILNSYEFVKFAFLAHIITTVLLFHRSNALTPEVVAKADFDVFTEYEGIIFGGKISEIGTQVATQLQQFRVGRPYLYNYIVFIVIILGFYILNIMFIKPLSRCFANLDCRISRFTNKKTQASDESTLEKEEFLNKSTQVKTGLNESNREYKTDRLKEIKSDQQYQFRQEVHQHVHKQLQARKNQSQINDFYSQVNFSQLLFQYKKALIDISSSYKRIYTFTKIKQNTTNPDVLAFFEKYGQLQNAYHESLIEKKEKIERQTDFYIEFVRQNFNILESYSSEKLEQIFNDKNQNIQQIVPDTALEGNYQRFILRGSQKLPSELKEIQIQDAPLQIEQSQKIQLGPLEENHSFVGAENQNRVEDQLDIIDEQEIEKSQVKASQEQYVQNSQGHYYVQQTNQWQQAQRNHYDFNTLDAEGGEDNPIDTLKPESINQQINSLQKSSIQIDNEEDNKFQAILRNASVQYLQKLKFLVNNIDPELMRTHYLPLYLKCSSHIQSYHIDGQDNEHFEEAIERAHFILSDPFLKDSLSPEGPN